MILLPLALFHFILKHLISKVQQSTLRSYEWKHVLSSYDRQHCRLSICSYFGWHWQTHQQLRRAGLSKLWFYLKDFLQWLHEKGFSPVCVLMWLCRSLAIMHLYLHWLHLCGFSPVCFLIICCFLFLFKLSVLMLENSHVVHLWGLSPEWVLLCCFILFEWIEEKSHCSHLCGFLPECCKTCCLRFETLSAGWIVALCAPLQFLPSVSEKKAFQLISLEEWQVALCTLVLLFSTVCQPVMGPTSSACKSPGTQNIWFAILHWQYFFLACKMETGEVELAFDHFPFHWSFDRLEVQLAFN